MISFRPSDSKIEQEKRRLAFLQDVLTRSNALTSGMISTLDHFEEKLQNVDELVTPVHEATNELHSLTMRIDQSLTVVDSILHYFDIFNQLTPIISAGPGGNLSEYLSELDRLEEAVKYFKSVTSVQERERVNQLFEKGKKQLVDEAEKLINRYANPLPGKELLDLCESNNQQTHYMQEEDMESLKRIIDWCGAHGFRQGLIDSYTTKKGTMIRRSLQLLDEHLNRTSIRRSSSNTPFIPNASTVTRSETMKRPSKPSGDVRTSLSRPSKTAMPSRVSSMIEDASNSNALTESSAQQQTSNYQILLDAFVALLQREDEVLNYIFPRDFQSTIFNKFIEIPLNHMKEKAETMCQSIEKTMHQLDPAQATIYGLIGILRWFVESTTKYPKLYQDHDGNRRTQLLTLSIIFQKSIINCFQGALDEIRSDTSPISQGGNVHSLTSHVLYFLEGLLNSEDIVAKIASAYVQEKSNMNQNKVFGKEKGLHDLGFYFTQLINTLYENLSKKSEPPGGKQDPILRSIFLLNNINYLLKRLENPTLLAIIQRYEPNLKGRYQTEFQNYLKDYTRCYSPLVLAIQKMLEYENHHHIPETKIRDRDREKLKESFSQINSAIDAIKQQCEEYIVSDVNLRQRLREEGKAVINEMYKSFYEKFARKDFTKHREKYIRYDPRQFETVIENFF